MSGLQSSRYAMGAGESTTTPQHKSISPVSGGERKATPSKHKAAFNMLEEELRVTKDALRIVKEKLERKEESEQKLWNAVKASHAKAYEVFPEHMTTLNSIFDSVYTKKERKKEDKSPLNKEFNGTTFTGDTSTAFEASIGSVPHTKREISEKIGSKNIKIKAVDKSIQTEKDGVILSFSPISHLEIEPVDMPTMTCMTDLTQSMIYCVETVPAILPKTETPEIPMTIKVNAETMTDSVDSIQTEKDGVILSFSPISHLEIEPVDMPTMTCMTDLTQSMIYSVETADGSESSTGTPFPTQGLSTPIDISMMQRCLSIIKKTAKRFSLSNVIGLVILSMFLFFYSRSSVRTIPSTALTSIDLGPICENRVRLFYFPTTSINALPPPSLEVFTRLRAIMAPTCFDTVSVVPDIDFHSCGLNPFCWLTRGLAKLAFWA